MGKGVRRMGKGARRQGKGGMRTQGKGEAVYAPSFHFFFIPEAIELVWKPHTGSFKLAYFPPMAEGNSSPTALTMEWCGTHMLLHFERICQL